LCSSSVEPVMHPAQLLRGAKIVVGPITLGVLAVTGLFPGALRLGHEIHS
jgi:hypothetical protein